MKNNRGRLWIVTGLLLLAAALCLTGYNLCNSRRAGQTARQTVGVLRRSLPAASQTPHGSGAERLPELPDYVLHPDMEMPTQTVDGTEYIGILSIPALELELPVISRWSDSGLRLAPCRYSGSAYRDDMVIAGHNYVTHFGGLKRLSAGDTVTFTDMRGNIFSYTVAELETLRPFEVEQMQSGDWDLTLFTCTTDSRSRVTVRCVRNGA